MTHNPNVQPTVYGIRGHRIYTQEEADARRAIIEQYDREHPPDPARLGIDLGTANEDESARQVG